jgi:hypothetical protein
VCEALWVWRQHHDVHEALRANRRAARAAGTPPPQAARLWINVSDMGGEPAAQQVSVFLRHSPVASTVAAAAAVDATVQMLRANVSVQPVGSQSSSVLPLQPRGNGSTLVCYLPTGIVAPYMLETAAAAGGPDQDELVDEEGALVKQYASADVAAAPNDWFGLQVRKGVSSSLVHPLLHTKYDWH